MKSLSLGCGHKSMSEDECVLSGRTTPQERRLLEGSRVRLWNKLSERRLSITAPNRQHGCSRQTLPATGLSIAESCFSSCVSEAKFTVKRRFPARLQNTVFIQPQFLHLTAEELRHLEAGADVLSQILVFRLYRSCSVFGFMNNNSIVDKKETYRTGRRDTGKWRFWKSRVPSRWQRYHHTCTNEFSPIQQPRCCDFTWGDCSWRARWISAWIIESLWSARTFSDIRTCLSLLLFWQKSFRLFIMKSVSCSALKSLLSYGRW